MYIFQTENCKTWKSWKIPPVLKGMCKIINFLLTVANMGRKQVDFFITTKFVWKKSLNWIFLIKISAFLRVTKDFPTHPFHSSNSNCCSEGNFQHFLKEWIIQVLNKLSSSQDPLFSIKVQANQILLFSEYNTQNQKIKCFNFLSTDHVKDILENTSEGCRTQKAFPGT